MDHSPAAQPLPPSWPDLLAIRPMPEIPPQARTVWVWGPAALHGVALCSAARVVASGRSVALIDGDLAFQVTPIVAMAKACRTAPDIFLRRLHLARALTCWQFTTLLCERLEPLLAAHPIGLILLLDPLTRFYDQDVTFKEATFLLQRVLQALNPLPSHWPPVLITQVIPAVRTRAGFARDLLREVEVGLRLLAGEGRWSVQVVKPKPPPSSAEGAPTRRDKPLTRPTPARVRRSGGAPDTRAAVAAGRLPGTGADGSVTPGHSARPGHGSGYS